MLFTASDKIYTASVEVHYSFYEKKSQQRRTLYMSTPPYMIFVDARHSNILPLQTLQKISDKHKTLKSYITKYTINKTVCY